MLDSISLEQAVQEGGWYVRRGRVLDSGLIYERINNESLHIMLGISIDKEKINVNTFNKAVTSVIIPSSNQINSARLVNSKYLLNVDKSIVDKIYFPSSCESKDSKSYYDVMHNFYLELNSKGAFSSICYIPKIK